MLLPFLLCLLDYVQKQITIVNGTGLHPAAKIFVRGNCCGDRCFLVETLASVQPTPCDNLLNICDDSVGNLLLSLQAIAFIESVDNF